MKHIVASLYHPQTSGKLECYHRTTKARVNLFTYNSLEALSQAIKSFVAYYNYRLYCEALGNLTPADVCYALREAIRARRKEMKQWTSAARRITNLNLS